MTACALCSELMCSTCRVTKKISYVGDTRTKQIFQRSIPFCKRCISDASQLSAFEVARDEVMSGMWAPGGSSSATMHRAASIFESADSMSLEAPSRSDAESYSGEMVESDNDEYAKDAVELNTLAATTGAAGISPYATKAGEVEFISLEQRGLSQSQHQQQSRPLDSQEELYLRVARLRDTAESISQITMNTTAMHLSSSSSQNASTVSPDVRR